mgnify:CR=1 FL=1
MIQAEFNIPELNTALEAIRVLTDRIVELEEQQAPKELYNNTEKLITHFETHSISRSKQLNNAILKIIK